MRYRDAVSCVLAMMFTCLLLAASGCNSGANPASAVRKVDLAAIDLPGTEDPELAAIANKVLDAQGLFLSKRLVPASVWQEHLPVLESKTSSYYPNAFAYWLLAGTSHALSEIPTDTADMRSLNAANKAVKLAPKSSYSHGLQGEIYRYRRDLDKSLKACKEAARLAPESLRAQLVLGCTLYERGRFEEATTHLEKAVILDPEYSRAKYHLGCAYGKLKRYFDAVPVLEEATCIDPEYLKAYWEMGELHREKKRWDRAADAYLEVIRIDPDLVEPHYMLAGVYYEDGKYKDAIREGREATRLDRCCAWGHYYVGMSNLQRGDRRSAESALKKALEYCELRSDLYWLARNALLEINPPRSSGGG